jgi:hypothetical protein
MSRLIALALALVMVPMSSTFAQQSGLIQHRARKRAQTTRSAPASDLSSSVIKAELKARGLNPSAVSTSAALREDFTEYHFQGGGKGLNPNNRELWEAAQSLSLTLSQTSLQSHVTIRTQTPGARVWYRLIGRDTSVPFNQITNDTAEDLSIGLYYVWAERNGKATSSKDIVFRIIQKNVPIDLVEVIQ